MHFLVLFFHIVIIPICSFCALTAEEDSQKIPHVLVSIAPHKFFVEKIAGNTVSVGLMVPAGASAHTFEPNPKQMMEASRAAIWFRVGEPFENKAISSLQSHNSELQVIDLRTGVELISCEGEGHCHCCNANGMDLHYWLSARQAKIQSKTITEALKRRYPHYANQYDQAFFSFSKELDNLDDWITQELQSLKNRTLMVSHPAYAYFARDYKLKQLSIEIEGKDPTPQQLTRILTQAREAHIKRIYIQKQYSNKGAKLIAQELGAEVIMLDPYSENYLESMKEITTQFAKN